MQFTHEGLRGLGTYEIVDQFPVPAAFTSNKISHWLAVRAFKTFYSVIHLSELGQQQHHKDLQILKKVKINHNLRTLASKHQLFPLAV